MTSTAETAAEVADAKRLDALRRSGLLHALGARHLDRLTDLARALTGAPVSLISMVDADEQYFAAQRGLGEPWASAGRTPLSHSVCQDVVASGDVVAINDMASLDRYRAHPARSDLAVEAYCGVPIRDPAGEVLGSFCVIDDAAHEWTDQTIDVLEHLAATVTEAVRANHEYAALIADLQGRLLPTELPQPSSGTLEGLYRQVPYSLAVGGDFYDALPRENGDVDVVLCDVIGHGVTSTHAAAQLRAASRAVLSQRVDDPAEAINRIAASVAGLPGCEGAALLVARLSADGRTATWARSGALPPVLTGPGARMLEGGACPPLGVDLCVFDPACQVSLEEGQGLLFFTDGLVERRGENLDLGFARLVDACRGTIGLPDLVEAICPGPTQSDDIAVVRWSARD